MSDTDSADRERCGVGGCRRQASVIRHWHWDGDPYEKPLCGPCTVAFDYGLTTASNEVVDDPLERYQDTEIEQ